MAPDRPLAQSPKAIAHFAAISAVDAWRQLIFGLWVLAPLVGAILFGAVAHFLS